MSYAVFQSRPCVVTSSMTLSEWGNYSPIFISARSGGFPTSKFRLPTSFLKKASSCSPRSTAIVRASGNRKSYSIGAYTPPLLVQEEARELDAMAPQNIPVLSFSEVANRLQDYGAKITKQKAFYSSVLGGITLDPAAMIIPMDDHMVHRGHAVFDTAHIYEGHLYELDAHLTRLLNSASKAKLTPPFRKSTLRDILVQTVAASGCRDGSLRYWLSAGPGGFSLSPKECERGSFYAVVVEEDHNNYPERAKVITSSIPIKPREFATMKSTNYLPNALVVMEAEEKGCFMGIWLDQDGYVAEGANMNVVFAKDGELFLPPFTNILAGCTAKRLLVLAQELVTHSGPGQPILKSIKHAHLTVDEGKAADEMMLVVSSYLLIPVVEWDGQLIGEGKVGPVAKALRSLLVHDVREGPATVRQPVPYRQ